MLQGQGQVPHRTALALFLGGTVIHHGDGNRRVVAIREGLEIRREARVRHDHAAPHPGQREGSIQEPGQNGATAHFQQRLGPIAGQGIEARGKARGKDDDMHGGQEGSG